MIWDARKIDDHAYRRRRVVIATVAIMASGIVVVSHLIDIAQRGWKVTDAFAVLWAGLAAYFARMAVSEFRLMRRAGGTK